MQLAPAVPHALSVGGATQISSALQQPSGHVDALHAGTGAPAVELAGIHKIANNAAINVAAVAAPNCLVFMVVLPKFHKRAVRLLDIWNPLIFR
jgi:hypothetical protein